MLMLLIWLYNNSGKVDMQEENENEAGGEDAEEIFMVDNPSLDLEVGF